MNREILRFVDTIQRDKQIDKEVVFVGIEQALISAAQKKTGSTEGVEVTIDRETGDIEATVDGEPLSPEDLGRIAALSGKQVLLQKIRQAERDVLYEEYKPRIGQLLTGTVQAKKGSILVISLGKTEGILPRSEQSPAENFNEGNRIKVVLKEVNLQENRVQLLCSRAEPDLVRRLFELEIPEVADYVVEIKAIAREAGHRTKIAVTTYDSNVDCVGACVGVKGARIRNIVDELFGEKIDIVRWNDSIEVLMLESLRPAEVASLDLDFESKTATVYVRPDQQSLAIGRRGQNVRLASKLTGWDLKITAVSDEELEEMRHEELAGRAENLFNEEMSQAQPAAEAPPASSSALDRLFAAPADGDGEATEADSAEDAAGDASAASEGDTVAPSTVDTSKLDSLFQQTGDEAAAAVDATAEPQAVPADDAGSNGGAAALTIEDLPGIGAATAERLREAGLGSPEEILEGGAEALA
ncbi:MAG: transcription termination factor NusA, partial [Planctomycetota bacterium]